MESFNFNKYEITMQATKSGCYDVRVFDVEAGATWLEWSGPTKAEARDVVLSFIETSAKDFLTFQIEKRSLKVYNKGIING